MTSTQAPEPPLLAIDAMTRSFGGFVALDNVSIEIRKGERFGLIGLLRSFSLRAGARK